MRIYAEPTDQMLKEINQAVKERGIGKTQIVLEALDQYLHGSDQGEMAQAIVERDKAKADLNTNWSEITRFRSEITALKADLEKSRSLIEKLQKDNDHLKETSDQASGELEGLRLAQTHFQETIRLRDQHISFLEGHLSQLTDKIQARLPPSQEEAKQKRWYQFWK